MKIWTILVLALVVVGMMPFALAAQSENGNDAEPAVMQVGAAGIAVGDTATVGEDVEAGVAQEPEPTHKRLRDGSDDAEPRPLPVKRFDAAKQRLQKARHEFAVAKERFEQARKKFNEVKPKYIAAKNKLRECKGNEDAECEQVRSEIKKNARPFLSNSADLIIESLNKLAAKIEDSNMPEDVKVERLEEINTKIAELEAAQATIDELSENASIGEVQEASQLIQNEWRHTKQVMRKNTGALVNEKIKHVIDQVGKLGDRLENAIGKIEERGGDTGDASDLLAEFRAKLAEANTEYEAAAALYEGVESSSDLDVAAINEHVRAAHAALKDTRSLLRDIVHELKGANNGDLDVENDGTGTTGDDNAEDEADKEDKADKEDESDAEDEADKEDKADKEDESDAEDEADKEDKADKEDESGAEDETASEDQKGSEDDASGNEETGNEDSGNDNEQGNNNESGDNEVTE